MAGLLSIRKSKVDYGKVKFPSSRSAHVLNG